jgi:Na+-translocating ferredoxin:NAD+ oxidoreductase subunit E
MKSFWQAIKNGLTTEAPPFRLVLGLCPALAVTTAAENGFWMGLAVIFVLAGSEVIISLIRGLIPDRVRIPVYIVVVATFVTVVDMAMKAYVPAMHAILGIYIPLIVVNCIILGRVEAFSSKQPALLALADAIGVGTGFLVSIMAIGAVREMLGTGNLVLFDRALLGHGLPFKPIVLMLLPPGAFLVMGFMLAGLALLELRRRQGHGSSAGAAGGANLKEASGQ